MSFKEKTTFSMLATQERKHGNRVVHLSKYRNRVLPVAAVYGGNASGKTNLFRALAFLQNLIVNGTKPGKPLPVIPFKLAKDCTKKATSFSILLLLGEVIVEFSFSATTEKIISESLGILDRGGNTKFFYQREQDEVQFGELLKEKRDVTGNAIKDSENEPFLRFVSQGTMPNQLFLTNSVFQNAKMFLPVYLWFKESLRLIAPDTKFLNFDLFIQNDTTLYGTMNKLFQQLDTGIEHLGGETVPLANAPIPEVLKSKIQSELEEGKTACVELDSRGNERYVISKKDGELMVQKLVSFHRSEEGEEVKFDLTIESDGSKRAIEIFPAFLDLSGQQNKSNSTVYVIDEIDRSLHPLLTYRLLEYYLATCSADKRTQLLFTTHDTNLMTQRLFRKDELWVTERNFKGHSRMIPLSDYKELRHDSDTSGLYMRGRLGGIPKLSL